MKRILVANRGEIAVRIFRTLREMGMQSVALTADQDTASVHARYADQVISLGPGALADTFLNQKKIIDLALAHGVEMIHPGYGFLSENADFSAAVEAAGMIFIGPEAASIRAMGLKREAKLLVAEAGVPTVPGYSGSDQSPATLQAAANEIGYPLLIKASAGGGGKGMKKVLKAAEFLEQLESAQREAQAAFGNDVVILEKYLTEPRHVEIQIFGDGKGQVVALGERECSIQRRHQKIVEEAPSPMVDKDLRERMCESAIAAAQAVNYRNAGTVEFICDASGTYYFMEMNTRLQVEHPVTEMVMGLDLVRLQIETALGQPLNLERIRQPRGWAMEVRLYAEDPDHGFLPQTGKICLYEEPNGLGIRMDSGVDLGSQISLYFDPMLAKLIAYGPTREACRARLIQALEHTFLHGLKTNVGFLHRVLSHPAFAAGHTTTGFIEEHFANPHAPDQYVIPALAAGYLADERVDLTKSPAQGPWEQLTNWRLGA
ncbi:MAG: 3-methylcrotonyl-CoA carboxylase [Acidobacteria bacterium]|nr:3-methylcrotonyl-CoA carboxylase [Acidobacteriota bacterium]MCB9398435.1 3-methylcrotonyl-CoA carboxylase [Acidobacteriota bacterium]